MTKNEIKKIISGNKPLLKKYHVKSLALFGSFVRNQQCNRSDVDLLVEFKKPTFDNYIGLRSELRRTLRRKVDLVSLKALKKNVKPYILKEAEWFR